MTTPDLSARRTELEKSLGVTLRDRDLLRRALTHRSYAYEHGGLPTNERLEFLGDAVLSIVITDHLYRSYPELPEGQLAKLRASVVNMNALADVSRRIGVGDWLLLGRGEEFSGGRDKASILADTFEALLGAVYLDRGMATAAKLVHHFFDDLIADAATRGASLDWKTSLQELTAAQLLGVPEYEVTESGPDHAKRFAARAVVGGNEWGSGEGRSKKEAEQRAAEAAWTAIQQQAQEDVVVLPGEGALATIGDGAAEVAGRSRRIVRGGSPTDVASGSVTDADVDVDVERGHS